MWRWTSCTADVPSLARTGLRCALAELGFACEVISDAVLAVSELVTNAIRYAAGPYEMRLRPIATEVICELVDHDPWIPEIPSFLDEAPYAPSEENRGGGLDALCALLSECGRGLYIVHELTNGAWGFYNQGSTKIAWYALPCPRDRFGVP
jgi:anti-sigma regulatory factor (Ser/Thr protein kinase)